MLKIALLCIALMSAIDDVSGSNILFFMPFGSISHAHSMAPLMEALAVKGHNVTLLSMHLPKQPMRNVTMLRLDAVNEVADTWKPNYFSVRSFNISLIVEMRHVMSDLSCRALLTDANFKRVTEDRNTHYDAVIMDMLMSECGLILVGLLNGPPLIYYCTTSLYAWKAWQLDVPVPYSAVPSSMIAVTDRMNFLDRLKNSVAQLLQLLILNFVHMPQVQKVVSEYHPNLPPLIEIERNVSLVLTNSHSASLDVSRPLAPFVIEVGGTHCRPSKALPKDLEDFISGAGDAGFIFFSLGSHISGTDMTPDKRAMFLKAFGRLKQRVLWKFEEDVVDRPPNVIIRQWAPQQDLLGHPSIKVFVTHGGQLSIQEAVYHGVPMLGMPVMADQLSNIKNMVEKGLAEELDYFVLNENEIFEKLVKLIEDPRYKKNSVKYATLMKDRPLDALETSVYWVEYVIRHRGALHLRLGASHLNFLQYFLIDVLAVICLIVFIVYKIVIFLAATILSKKKESLYPTKQKTN